MSVTGTAAPQPLARLPSRELGKSGLFVSQLGLGCMGLTFAYDVVTNSSAEKSDGNGTAPPTAAAAAAAAAVTGESSPSLKTSASESAEAVEARNIELIRTAYLSGVTFFDTAESYGPHTNEILLGKAFKACEIPRENIVIATKMGIYRDTATGKIEVTNKPARIRAALEGSLARLQTSYVDLYYIHRVDVDTPIEEVAATMLALKEEGKIRHWGMSEACAATIRRAHAVCPVTAVQNEYSILCRDVEGDILPCIEELGIGLVTYSPLGRAFLTATIDPSNYGAKDIRGRDFPRLHGDNFVKNQPLVALVKEWAERKGCTPAQFALGWLYAQKPYLVPIPGTTKLSRLEENISASAMCVLTAEESAAFNDSLGKITVYGDRYVPEKLRLINH